MLRLEAWRHGASIQIEKIDGSIFEPITFGGTHLSCESQQGAITRLEVREAAAQFSWRNLFKRGTARWLERLTLDGVTGKMTFPLEAGPGGHRFDLRQWLPHGGAAPGPGRIEAREVDFVLQTNGDYVRIQEARCTLSESEPGTFAAGQLVVKQPWLHRTFRDLRGTTKIEGPEIEITGIELEPGVKLERIAAELDQLARGSLNAVGQLAAFDGVVRFETRTLPKERPFVAELTATFAQINVAKLVSFLALPNAAGGTIKDGKFTFRGSPHQPTSASATLRLDATNFQWDARQWDSLVLGARLMNGRIEMPQLSLIQGQNRLDLDGEFALPEAGRHWWQSAFDARIKAKIEDLTAISALMLPEFRYAAGKATIDGSVRGRDEKFDGQLIVTGSHLQWRSAPIDELHAALKLNGNELHIANLSIFNDGDFVRGRGVVNILGPMQYWGELRAAVQDLGTYAALLQPPIVPEPLAGGATIDWNGEGSAKGHTGSFLARLNKLRSLGATASLLHPINASLEGSYSPGRMLFSQFALSDDESSFSANVAVGDKALSLKTIKLRHKQHLWLEGDAVLPLDLWRAWPNTSIASLLDDTAETAVNLTAYNLSLREASALTGWSFPIEGVIAGNLVANGRLGALATSGKLTLARGRIPLGWSGSAFTGVEGGVTFQGQTMTLDQLAGRHPTGDFRASGSVDFASVRDPRVKLALVSDRTSLVSFQGQGSVTLVLALKTTVEGPMSAAGVRGDARPLSVEFGSMPDLKALWVEGAPRSFPELFTPIPDVLERWSFDLACVTTEPLALEANGGRVAINARMAGPGAELQWSGKVSFSQMAATAGAAPLNIEEGMLDFRPGLPANPTIALAVSGTIHGAPFTTHFSGPLSHFVRDTNCAPPLTAAAIRDFIVGDELPAHADGARFSLQVPAILTGGAEVYDWPVITEPVPAVPPGVAQ